MKLGVIPGLLIILLFKSPDAWNQNPFANILLEFYGWGPRTNVNWISSLSDSDRLEIQLTFGFRCWWLSLSAQPAFASQKLQCEVFLSLVASQQIWSTTYSSLNQTGVGCSFRFVGLAWCVCCQSKQNGAKRFCQIVPGEFSLNNIQGLFVPTKAFSLRRHSHSKLQQFKWLCRMTRTVLANIPTILQWATSLGNFFHDVTNLG